jgi:phosphoglycerate dehydrogenase-like enzyme
MGNIGRELFRVAQPFGMTFIAHDPYADPGQAAQLGVELVELDDVFRRADFVSINCPLTESTRHLVNRERLHLMKPDAYLINTSRGPLVDQSALTQVLRSGRIAGAGLDVLETEPPEADDPILTLDNVIITPHALCWTDQLFQGNGRADVVAVMKVISGELPTGIVNREIVSSPVWVDRLAGYRSRFV